MPTRIKLEADVEKPVVGRARGKGVLVVKQTHAGARSHPDRGFYFLGGRLLQIEFKQFGKPPTPLQAAKIIELIGLGFIVVIVDTVALGNRLVDFYLGHTSNELPIDNVYIKETLKKCNKVLKRKARV